MIEIVPFLFKESGWLEDLAVLAELKCLMISRGCPCVTLSLTSKMQRLCVESWTVGLLYRCWEQLLLTKETLKCGHKRFSAEEMSLIYLSVQLTNNFLKHICCLFHTVKLNSLFFVQVTLISGW